MLPNDCYLNTKRKSKRCGDSLLLVRRLSLTLSSGQGELELKTLKKLEPGPKTDELNRFYDLSLRIVNLNTAVLEGVLSHPSAAKMLSTGRIVILSNGVRQFFNLLESCSN